MKRFIQISILSFICITTFGQKDTWVKGFGMCYFTDFNIAPLQAITPANRVKPTNVVKEYNISFYTLSFENQFKLIELNNNTTIGLHVAPRFRLSLGTGGTTSFAVPAYITLNTGLLSTVDTDKDKGLSIGLGLLTQSSGLIPGSQFGDGGDINKTKAKIYLQPSLYLAHRFWKGEKVHELALRIGYAKHKDIVYYDYNDSNNTYQENHSYDGKNVSFSINLTFTKYFNY